MKIFSGSSNKPLAERIAKLLKIELSQLEIHLFPDEEKRVRVKDRVIGEDCIVVQSASINADKNYMELFFIIDALKRNGAKSITAVIPYLGYQRQDHIFRDGEAVSLDVIIKLLESVGIDKIITFDLHSIKIPELFHIPIVHLSALPIFAEKVREFLVARGPATPRLDLSKTVLVSPDMGGIRRIKILSKMLGNIAYAAVVKNRDVRAGKISVSDIKGEVKKTAIIVDDMVSTGRTIVLACDFLRKKGVEKIFIFATHPVFSQDASEVLQQAFIERVFVTDTIDVPKDKQFAKLEVLSVGEIISESLEKNY